MNLKSFKSSSLWVILTTPISKLFTNWLQNEFVPVLPRRWKRAIYVATIIGMTSFVDKPDFLLFNKINDALRLSYRGQTLWMPKFMRNIVWGPLVNQSIYVGNKQLNAALIDEKDLSVQELDSLCEYFIARTPEWIKYGPDSFIKNDLRECLTELFIKRFSKLKQAI